MNDIEIQDEARIKTEYIMSGHSGWGYNQEFWRTYNRIVCDILKREINL